MNENRLIRDYLKCLKLADNVSLRLEMGEDIISITNKWSGPHFADYDKGWVFKNFQSIAELMSYLEACNDLDADFSKSKGERK